MAKVIHLCNSIIKFSGRINIILCNKNIDANKVLHSSSKEEVNCKKCKGILDKKESLGTDDLKMDKNI